MKTQTTVKPTQEENNRLIAEFMNLKGASKVGGWRYLCDDGYWRIPSELDYHKSWDRLMTVIEKISKLNLPDPDNCSESWQPFPRTFGMINDDNGFFMFRFNRYGIHEAPILIEAAYSAVVSFVKGVKLSEKGGSHG